MANLPADELSPHDNIVVVEAPSLPDAYHDYIGDIIHVRSIDGDVVHCTADDGKDLSLMRGEFDYPDYQSSYYKQKQELNL